MVVSLKLSGDNLTGKFDTELMSANPLIVAQNISGVPWFKVGSSAVTKIIGRSPLGSPATTYFGFAFRKSGNPASSQVMLHPFTSAGATSFRLRLSSTGTIILDGAATNGLDTSAALANDTTYAIIGQVSATVATVSIYAADGTTLVDTITATNTFGLVDNWRMGQIGTSPAIPDWFFRMLLVGDTSITAAQVLAVPSAAGTRKIGFIGDSNTAAMGTSGQPYFDALTTAGISTRDVYFWGVGGKRIAVADLTGKTAANNITDAAAWHGTFDTWVVALGTNDRPQTDATINTDIDTLLAAIGTGPKVIWVGLTSKATASTDDVRVNNLIKAKLTARGNAEFADWDAHIRAVDGGANPSPYWLTTDSTHMTPAGYEVRAEFIADLLATTAVVDIAGTGSLTLGGSASRSIRVSRSGAGSVTLTGTATATVQVSRTAVGTLNLTATGPRTITVTRAGQGTVTLNGSAVSDTGDTDRTGTGTLNLAGTAQRTLSTARAGVGGLTVAGSATSTVTVSRTAQGVLALAGTGLVDTGDTDRAGVGTLTLTGSGIATVALSRTATGVLNLTGSGTRAATIVRTATGTFTLTGQGVTEHEHSPFPDRLTLDATSERLELTATAPTLTLEAT